MNYYGDPKLSWPNGHSLLWLPGTEGEPLPAHSGSSFSSSSFLPSSYFSYEGKDEFAQELPLDLSHRSSRRSAHSSALLSLPTADNFRSGEPAQSTAVAAAAGADQHSHHHNCYHLFYYLPSEQQQHQVVSNQTTGTGRSLFPSVTTLFIYNINNYHFLTITGIALADQQSTAAAAAAAVGTSQHPSTTVANNDDVANQRPPLPNAGNSRATFHCRVCPSTFTQSSSLRSHMLTSHSAILVLPCSVCGKVFHYHQWHLQQQQQQHLRSSTTPPRPFNCHRCFASFAQEGDLLGHLVRVHVDRPPLPFGCELCGKRYSHQGSVKRHKRAKHSYNNNNNLSNSNNSPGQEQQEQQQQF